MVETMLASLRAAKPLQPNITTLSERLRNAGYADGERLPRLQSHWANRTR
jgi:hypothetical protein